MKYYEYLQNVTLRMVHGGAQGNSPERKGQAYMNELGRVRPDLYKLIRDMSEGGLNADPYYNDENLQAFFEVLERNW